MEPQNAIPFMFFSVFWLVFNRIYSVIVFLKYIFHSQFKSKEIFGSHSVQFDRELAVHNSTII